MTDLTKIKATDKKAFVTFVKKEGHTMKSEKAALDILRSRFNRGETKSFNPYRFRTGILNDLSEDEYPTVFKAWHMKEEYARLELDDDGTHYGFVHKGSIQLESEGVPSYRLTEGMFFCVVGKAIVKGNGSGIVITRLGFNGAFQIGGPIEEKGRLRYIDGCTDSLLVPPVIKGDPCLNLLHFPKGIDQTAHTHPTLRIGIVTRGSGWCRIDGDKIRLTAGMPFIIQPEGLHGFMTEDEEMTVVAWHPDTDMGPEHDNHPMVNRTMVKGVSAAKIDEIRTKEI